MQGVRNHVLVEPREEVDRDQRTVDPYSGKLKIETPLIKAGVPLEDIGFEDEVFDNSGVLPRYLKLFRLPTINPHQTLQFERKVALDGDGDNPIFMCRTTKNGA